jgi:hypothetical protein
MRDELLNGKLSYPGSAIFDLYPDQVDEIEAFWKAVWYNFLNDQETNGVHWYDRLGCKLYNDIVRRLSHHNWVISKAEPGRKWATVKLNADKLLDFVEVEELMRIRANYKYSKYQLECRDAKASTLVRQNGKTKRTGLVRTGFRDAGNTQFGYDMAKLKEYEDAVKLNLTKSMDKIRKDYPEMQCDDASYDVVSVGIFDWHYDNQLETFTTGDSISDSRGRAISQGLKKVANPISSKDFRAALVITYDE